MASKIFLVETFWMLLVSLPLPLPWMGWRCHEPLCWERPWQNHESPLVALVATLLHFVWSILLHQMGHHSHLLCSFFLFYFSLKCTWEKTKRAVDWEYLMKNKESMVSYFINWKAMIGWFSLLHRSQILGARKVLSFRTFRLPIIVVYNYSLVYHCLYAMFVACNDYQNTNYMWEKI